MTIVKLTELFPARFRGAVVVLPETVTRDDDYVLQYSDRAQVVPIDAPVQVTVTVPAGTFFPVGTVINVYNSSNDQTVLLVGESGVTLVASGELLAPKTEVSLRYRGNNEWVVAGTLV